MFINNNSVSRPTSYIGPSPNLATDADSFRKQANIVFTMDDIISKILRAEFGYEFADDCGFDEMVYSIKRGLSGHLQATSSTNSVKVLN